MVDGRWTKRPPATVWQKTSTALRSYYHYHHTKEIEDCDQKAEYDLLRPATLDAKSGKGGKGGKVKSRKQAIAIALSKARKKGKKVPRRKK